MALDKKRVPPTSGLAPAPVVEQPLQVEQKDIDDEKLMRELAAQCFAAYQNDGDPKQMAEGLKAFRIARGIREKINEIENDAKRMAFKAAMTRKR